MNLRVLLKRSVTLKNPMYLSLTMTIGITDLAIPTFPVEIEYLPALSPGNLPAGTFLVLIGGATGVNLLRTPQEIPAGGFPAPKSAFSDPHLSCLKGNPF